METCKKCKGKLFEIEILKDCAECDFNPAYDDETESWITDQATIDKKELVRDMVENDCECSFGSAYGGGCYMFRCNNCGHMFNLSLIS